MSDRRSASRHAPARHTTTDTHALRLRIIETARRMNALGINRGKSGNVSARIDHGFLVTPSALDYDKTRPEDVVAIDNADNTIGRRSPSSEWRFHRDIYAARTDVEAIVHTHAPFATTIACLDRGIPPFHYMVAAAGGGDIRCAPYATFGTQALSDAAVRALDGRRACLLAHHGMIAVGASLDAALALAVEVETLAQMYCQALAIGEPRLLNEGEMREVIERFADYRPHIAHGGRR
jgi:L-fuculose-phosphate aldolase